MAESVSRPYAVQSIARIARPKINTGLYVDPLSRKLHQQLLRVAASPLNVLVEGDTGTGKEVAAREIHQHSGRPDKPFVAVNCGAIPAELIESELFGHERGTFTGASEQKKGWFEVAEGGTLFLDEISELPLASQVKLLRVLQEKEVTRLGSRKAIAIDVRLIAATNRSLGQQVENGLFREDLYYRLNVATLELRPLRERPGDILPLSEFFLIKYQFDNGLSNPASFSPAAHEKLLQHGWPGNIRELENVIQYALLMTDKPEIGAEALCLEYDRRGGLERRGQARAQADEGAHRIEPSELGDNAAQLIRQGVAHLLKSSSGNLLNDVERLVVTEAYQQCAGNQVHAASLLGITRSMLRLRLKRYGLL